MLKAFRLMLIFLDFCNHLQNEEMENLGLAFFYQVKKELPILMECPLIMNFTFALLGSVLVANFIQELILSFQVAIW